MDKELGRAVVKKRLEGNQPDFFESLVHMIKAAMLLNSGAIIAMLGFIQAIVSKDASLFAAFKPYVMLSCACFILGAWLSATSFGSRLQYLRAENENSMTKHHLLATHKPRFAIFLFLAGAILCFVGIFKTF